MSKLSDYLSVGVFANLEMDFTSSGAISLGDFVGLNSDGTVSTVDSFALLDKYIGVAKTGVADSESVTVILTSGIAETNQLLSVGDRHCFQTDATVDTTETRYVAGTAIAPYVIVVGV